MCYILLDIDSLFAAIAVQIYLDVQCLSGRLFLENEFFNYLFLHLYIALYYWYVFLTCMKTSIY